jgi:hypothetical protein
MENNSRQTMSKYVDLKNSIQTSVVHTMIQFLNQSILISLSAVIFHIGSLYVLHLFKYYL